MGDDQRPVERLAAMEAKLATLEGVLMRLEAKLDAWQSNYVPRAEINEMFRARDSHLEQLRVEIKEVRASEEHDRQANKSVWPLWTAAIVSLVALGVSLYK